MTDTIEEDIDIETVEDNLFHQELSELVSTFAEPTQEQQTRYNEKMAFLESVRLEVFGPPKPVEWEHDAIVDYKYVEPYNSTYSVNRSATYWQIRKNV